MRLRAALIALLSRSLLHAQSPSDPYGLTTDFRNWLTSHGYGSYQFERGDVPGGAYGGRTTPGQAVVNQPVIFIHGTSARRISLATTSGGW